MYLMLTVLTSISFAAAVGFGILAWQLLRGDRRRSAARVAALSSAIDGEREAVRLKPDTTYDPYDATLDAQPVDVASGSSRTDTPMFAPAPPLKGRAFIKLAVAGVMMAVIGVAVILFSGPPAASRPGAAAPLELMSMTSAREGTTIKVTGLVHNPSAGAEVRRVTAVVLAFNSAGAMVASGRAPLDFAVLDPDDESPFVVTVPNSAGVERIRVSFRTDTGALRHIDRRAAQSQLARSQ